MVATLVLPYLPAHVTDVRFGDTWGGGLFNEPLFSGHLCLALLLALMKITFSPGIGLLRVVIGRPLSSCVTHFDFLPFPQSYCIPSHLLSDVI